MKKLIVIACAFAFTSSAFANDPAKTAGSTLTPPAEGADHGAADAAHGAKAAKTKKAKKATH